LQASALSQIEPTESNLTISHISRSLPNISFTRSSKPLVALKTGQDATKAKWYNNIYFSTSSYYKNNQNFYFESIYNAAADSLEWLERNVQKSAITHNISFTSSQKLLGIFTTNQTLSLDEGWVFKYDLPVYDDSGRFTLDEKNKIISQSVNDFKARHIASFTMSAQTKAYGLFPLRIAGLQAVRHVITPSVSMTFRPDFTQEIFGWDPGYIIRGIDTTGTARTFDPLSNTMLGALSSYETRTMSIGLNNLLQAKLGRGDKTRKIDLFSLNSSTSYNFAADSLNWSTILTTFRTQVTKKITINLNATHDLYAFKNNRRVNEWNDSWYGIPIPRLTSVSASTAFSLSGKRFGTFKNTEMVAPDSVAQPDTTGINLISPSYSQAVDRNPPADMDNSGSQLWTANFGLRYSLSQPNPAKRTESFFMTTSFTLNLTSKWKIIYSNSLNLLEKKIVTQSINISRDLHCWQLAFQWTPSGYGKQYSLIINIKSPTLRDLKYEERGGRRSNLGW